MKITDEHLRKILLDFGLTDKEARIYVSALGLGTTTILMISKISGLKRPTVYTIIDSLVRKGLFSIELKGFKKMYRAENPDRLKAIFDGRRHELIETLPYFKELYSKNASSALIRYHEGKEAIQFVY